MTLIYRLEGLSGKGAFQGVDEDDHEYRMDDDERYGGKNPNRLATPWGDGIVHFQDGVHHCACKDIRQLFLWFTPDYVRHWLMGGGYLLEIDLDGRKVARGDTQVAYKKEDIRNTRYLNEWDFENIINENGIQ